MRHTCSARFLVLLAAAPAAAVLAPPALADVEVTYEVLSDKITTASVRYFGEGGVEEEETVQLPWRISTSVEDLSSLARGAEIHAAWKALPETEVTVRIIADGKPVCQAVQRNGAANCNSAMFS